MYYPDDIIEEVRNRNDIVGVISQVVNLKKKGGSYFGLCPFHSEKTGSFSVSQEKQMYYCFGCGAGGNVISFVMNYENFGFQEAVEALAERAGMELPKIEQSAEAKAVSDKKAKMLAAYKDAATFYYKALRSPVGARAKEYFEKRHLSEETMQKFGLGYAMQSPQSLYTFLKSKGYTDEILDQSQLLKINEKGAWDRFYNRAIYPIMDVRNRVIGFGGRVMGEGEPKYLNSPETPIFDKSRNLYGLNFARSSRRPYFLLCEGYMDVIALHQAGIDCAVASLGTALTSGHASLIKRYVEEVIITYDSDGAGRKAALRAIPLLKAAGLKVKVLDMKPHKDPDEFICNLGVQEYEKRISEAINSFYFETDVLYGRHNMNDPEEKTSFHRELAAKLTDFTDALERDNYLTAVCGRYGIPADYLKEMVNKAGNNKIKIEYDEIDERPIPGAGKYKKEKDVANLSAQRLVLSFLASGNTEYDKIKELILPDYFTDEVCKTIADGVFEKLKKGEKINPAGMLDEFSVDAEERSKAAAVFAVSLPEDSDEASKILEENIKLLKRNYIDNALRNTTDPNELMVLIKEKSNLDKLKIELL